jgi:hypothetical protein
VSTPERDRRFRVKKRRRTIAAATFARRVPLEKTAARVWGKFATWQRSAPDVEPPPVRVPNEIGAAPAWLWAGMVAVAIAEGWTVEMAKLRRDPDVLDEALLLPAGRLGWLAP